MRAMLNSHAVNTLIEYRLLQTALYFTAVYLDCIVGYV